MEINFYTTQSNQNDYNIYEYNLCDFHWKIVAFYVFAVKFVEKTKDISYFKIIFMAITVIILTTVAVLSAKLNDILLKKPDLMVKINKISAFILLLLAIALAFT